MQYLRYGGVSMLVFINHLIGTGEQIIRGGLARSIGEACNPDTCEDPIEALSTVFENLIGEISSIIFVLTD